MGNATKESSVLYCVNIITCDLGEYTSETCDAGAGEDKNDKDDVGDNGGDDHDDNGGSNDEGGNGGICACITSCENRKNGDYQVIQLTIGTLVRRHREKLFGNYIINARKRSLRRLCFHRCLSVHRGSLSKGGLCPRDLCPRGSLSRGVSVWGLSVQGVSVQGISVQGGLYPGVSVWGSLSRGVCIQGSLSRGISVRETPPVWLSAGSKHPTGMHSCLC